MPHGLQARSPKGADAILASPKDAPIPLPPEAWPMLVTCDDIARPEIVPPATPMPVTVELWAVAPSSPG